MVLFCWKQLFCVANILDTSTKPTALSFPSFLLSNLLNFTSLKSLLAESAYLCMLFTQQLLCTTHSVAKLQSKSQSHKVTSVILGLGGGLWTQWCWGCGDLWHVLFRADSFLGGDSGRIKGHRMCLRVLTRADREWCRCKPSYLPEEILAIFNFM